MSKKEKTSSVETSKSYSKPVETGLSCFKKRGYVNVPHMPLCSGRMHGILKQTKTLKGAIQSCRFIAKDGG
jgi:hypothetical protein